MSKKLICEGQKIAKARDQYFAGEGASSLQGKAEGVYLQNRMEKAFIAGWNAAKKSLSKKGQK